MAVKKKKFSELSQPSPLPVGAKLTAVAESGVVGRNLSINLQEMRAPGLPAGYKLCAYVESNRDCYIDTGIPSSDKVGIQMTYMYLGPTPTTSGEAIIGAGKSTDGTRQWINDASITSGSGLCVGWGGDSDLHGIPSQPGKIAFGQVNFMMSNTATVTIPEATETPTDLQLGYDAKFSSNTLYLFATNSGSGAGMFTHSRLYRCRISEGRQIKRDFVPVRRESDGKYGLFESIEKKVYFPEQGNLTGSELSSIWDYSHFNGVEGAYIDDYPTPDSPNFVKASGVEAGMAQIREALMVGPMIPNVNPSRSSTIYKQKNVYSQFLSFLKNSTVPASLSPTTTARNASGFLYIPNFTWATNSYITTGLYISEAIQDYSDSNSLIKASPFYSGVIGLGLTTTKYKSIYAITSTVGNAGQHPSAYSAISPVQSNLDSVLVTPGYCAFYAFSSGTASAIELINSNMRCLCSSKIATGNLASVLDFRDLGKSKIYVTGYLPLYAGDSYYDGTGFQTGFRTNSKVNISFNLYLPSRGHAGTSSLKGFYLFIGSANDIKSIVYTLRTIRRNTPSTFKSGINANYFSVETASEESTDPAATTYTTTCTKSDRSVVIINVVTNGTTKTTTTYTLLPDTDSEHGEECKLLRNALWNTDGIKHPTTGEPTSTGLLDGIRQTGRYAGSAYTSYWTLDLRPVIPV